ncbi:hypothetical protein AVEN_185194-1 [Araneus ventricosus]|uniref:Uncharacterized protein n=1 Tax=Araneus ventricosus TaxID=182803 RepID=A0A4Y2P038_ARAVE|nr:hypothetical protein AVEN_185194-1 [Araneus ventricosus]
MPKPENNGAMFIPQDTSGMTTKEGEIRAYQPETIKHVYSTVMSGMTTKEGEISSSMQSQKTMVAMFPQAYSGLTTKEEISSMPKPENNKVHFIPQASSGMRLKRGNFSMPKPENNETMFIPQVQWNDYNEGKFQACKKQWCHVYPQVRVE